MVLGDIDEVAELLKTHRLECVDKAGFNVFRPVKLMLAQTAQTIKEALVEYREKSAFEYKYDGAWVQIHKQNDEVKIFSRRLSDVTESLPEITEIIRRNIVANSLLSRVK